MVFSLKTTDKKLGKKGTGHWINFSFGRQDYIGKLINYLKKKLVKYINNLLRYIWKVNYFSAILTWQWREKVHNDHLAQNCLWLDGSKSKHLARKSPWNYLLHLHTHSYTIYIYVFIYIYVCVYIFLHILSLFISCIICYVLHNHSLVWDILFFKDIYISLGL